MDPIILRELIRNEEFMRRVLPYIKDSYFDDKTERFVFNMIRKHVDEYNYAPVPEVMKVAVSSLRVDKPDEFTDCMEVLNELESDLKEAAPVQLDWVINTTEKFCQDQAISNAVFESVSIIEKKENLGAMIPLLQDAMAVTFNAKVGHEYMEQAEDRYHFYHRKEAKTPFNIEWFNKVTNGGVPSKTLNIVMAGVHVGKSLFMCHHAAHCLKIGKKVLYITLEMSEESVGERIDENLMRLTQDELHGLNQEEFLQEFGRVKDNTEGRLFIREFPTSTAHVGHFRALLSELMMKKQFKPDVIFVDYLNICASSRVKAADSLYSYVKAIAEELRGLAVEFDVQIWSATQLTRKGFSDTDVDMTDTAESFGLPATADFHFALIDTDEFHQEGKLKVKILKCRYSDSAGTSFVIGVTRKKMTLYDLEDEAQNGILGTPQQKAKAQQRRYGQNPDDEVTADQKFQQRFSQGAKILSALKDEMKWT